MLMCLSTLRHGKTMWEDMGERRGSKMKTGADRLGDLSIRGLEEWPKGDEMKCDNQAPENKSETEKSIPITKKDGENPIPAKVVR